MNIFLHISCLTLSILVNVRLKFKKYLIAISFEGGNCWDEGISV